MQLSAASPEPAFRKVIECTQGIAFLGTPHYGSDKADLAHLLLNAVNLFRPADRDIVRVLEPDSEVNTNIRDGFFEMLRARNLDHKEPSWIVCFYEEKPMSVAGKTFFVSLSSSSFLPQLSPCDNSEARLNCFHFLSPGCTEAIRETGRLQAEGHIGGSFQHDEICQQE